MNEYGKDEIIMKAKEFEKLGFIASDALNKMTEIGIIYDSTTMSYLSKSIGWLMSARARSYQSNINEYGIDKSLLKSLVDVNDNEIKHSTELYYFYNLVNKIYSLIHENSNNIKDCYINIENLNGKIKIQICDIIDNKLSQKEFLRIIRSGTDYRDDITYFILNATLDEIQKKIGNI